MKKLKKYICRKALIESAGDPLKEVGEETKKLFLQYTYQVKMLETLTFSRNKHMIERSEQDVLVMCTDAGFNPSMMVFYIGKQAEEELKLEFVFSIGNLNNESGIIPRCHRKRNQAMRETDRVDDTSSEKEDYDC